MTLRHVIGEWSPWILRNLRTLRISALSARRVACEYSVDRFNGSLGCFVSVDNQMKQSHWLNAPKFDLLDFTELSGSSKSPGITQSPYAIHKFPWKSINVLYKIISMWISRFSAAFHENRNLFPSSSRGLIKCKLIIIARFICVSMFKFYISSRLEISRFRSRNHRVQFTFCC